MARRIFCSSFSVYKYRYEHSKCLLFRRNSQLSINFGIYKFAYDRSVRSCVFSEMAIIFWNCSLYLFINMANGEQNRNSLKCLT